MDLGRFITAQEAHYETALSELRAGKKESHWMWFIFPQLRVLGRSPRAQFFGISGRAEAEAFLSDDVLGKRLIICCEALLIHVGHGAEDILGGTDAMKLRSSMTLFRECGENEVFSRVLMAFCDDIPCEKTITALDKE